MFSFDRVKCSFPSQGENKFQNTPEGFILFILAFFSVLFIAFQFNLMYTYKNKSAKMQKFVGTRFNK